MAEHLGKMIECDRCGKTYFLNCTGVAQFDKKPDGWKAHIEIGLLCKECEKLYQEMLEEFFYK